MTWTWEKSRPMPSHKTNPFDLAFLGKETLFQLHPLLRDRGLHPLLREPSTWTPAEGDTSFELVFDPARLDVAVAALADAIRERQFVQFYKPDMPATATVPDPVLVVASATLRLALMVVRNYAAATNTTSYRFVVRGRVSELATRVRSGRERLSC